MGQLTQLGQRQRQRLTRVAHERLGHSLGWQFRLQQTQRHRDRDQALLCPVVQVALDPPPLGVGRLDEPRPRRLQLDQARPELGLQALILQRQARGGAHGPHELGVVLQHRIVQQRRDRLSVALDEGRTASAVLVWELDRDAVAVDVTLLGREPERQLERRVAERSRERLAQADGCAGLAQLDHEPRDLPRASRRWTNTYSTAIGTIAVV